MTSFILLLNSSYYKHEFFDHCNLFITMVFSYHNLFQLSQTFHYSFFNYDNFLTITIFQLLQVFSIITIFQLLQFFNCYNFFSYHQFFQLLQFFNLFTTCDIIFMKISQSINSII